MSPRRHYSVSPHLNSTINPLHVASSRRLFPIIHTAPTPACRFLYGQNMSSRPGRVKHMKLLLGEIGLSDTVGQAYFKAWLQNYCNCETDLWAYTPALDLAIYTAIGITAIKWHVVTYEIQIPKSPALILALPPNRRNGLTSSMVNCSISPNPGPLAIIETSFQENVLNLLVCDLSVEAHRWPFLLDMRTFNLIYLNLEPLDHTRVSILASSLTVPPRHLQSLPTMHHYHQPASTGNWNKGDLSWTHRVERLYLWLILI